jgi:hypothetical protein
MKCVAVFRENADIKLFLESAESSWEIYILLLLLRPKFHIEMAKKGGNLLVKCALKIWKYFYCNWIYKYFRNEIFHIQCTTHNVLIPIYRFTIRFNSEHSHYYANFKSYIFRPPHFLQNKANIQIMKLLILWYSQGAFFHLLFYMHSRWNIIEQQKS